MNERSLFFFKVSWKVDQSRNGPAKESHFKLYHSKNPKSEQPYWNVKHSTMEVNTKNQLTLTILRSIQGPGKPAEEFLEESMAENERKNEIIGANYAWNIRSPVNLCKPWLNLGATSGSGSLEKWKSSCLPSNNIFRLYIGMTFLGVCHAFLPHDLIFIAITPSH